MCRNRPDPNYSCRCRPDRSKVDWVRLTAWIFILIFCLSFWIAAWNLLGIRKLITFLAS